MNIPEKWFFKGTKESEKQSKNSGYYKYFSENFGKDYGFFVDSRYYSDGKHNFMQDKLRSGFTEISFEDFKCYVLREKEKSIDLW